MIKNFRSFLAGLLIAAQVFSPIAFAATMINPANQIANGTLPPGVIATNATNLTGSGTISATTTGGAGLSVNTALYLSSQALNGSIATTQAIGDSSTKFATTAFVNPGSSIAANGYRKFPDGLIVQWGRVTLNVNPTSYSFPIAFPHADFTVSLTAESATGQYCNLNAPATTTTFTAICSNGVIIDYVAYGY